MVHPASVREGAEELCVRQGWLGPWQRFGRWVGGRELRYIVRY